MTQATAAQRICEDLKDANDWTTLTLTPNPCTPVTAALGLTGAQERSWGPTTEEQAVRVCACEYGVGVVVYDEEGVCTPLHVCESRA